MDRREAIAGLIVGASGLTTDLLYGIDKKTDKKESRFLIVVSLCVGNLPPFKAEAFCKKVKDCFVKNKPAHFDFLIQPQRVDKTTVSVYSLNGEPWEKNKENMAWFEKHIAEGKINLIKPEFVHEAYEISDQEILEHCMLMFGAPVIVLPAHFEDYVGEAIKKGRRWGVNDLKDFCFEYMMEIYADENYCQI